MAINFNINCDNVDMPKSDLVDCNFKARLFRLPIGVVFLVVGLIFVIASSDWVPRIIGSAMLLAGIGFFAVLIFNRQLSEREWDNNQLEIKSHMEMASVTREDAVRQINSVRIANRTPVYSTRRPAAIPQQNVLNINI